jgi:hypothetical protein
MPEQSRHKQTYQEIAPRVALETLARIAAVEEKIAIEVLPRPTVRSRLGISRADDLASHVGKTIAQPVGRYWTAGRDVAALAALAGLRVAVPTIECSATPVHGGVPRPLMRRSSGRFLQQPPWIGAVVVPDTAAAAVRRTSTLDVVLRPCRERRVGLSRAVQNA